MGTLPEIEAAIDALSESEQRALLQRLSAKLSEPTKSLHDLLKDGCGIIDSGIPDLATNPNHLKQYGQ